ncbi:MAG: hypothetical protein HKN42_00110 [Granulosicoccus sp.]|nr:hypothetical protein [Granulosicoccus sp.]
MIGAQYQHIALRVDALQLRERVMLLIVCVVLMVFLVDSMGFQPVFKKQESVLKDIQEKEHMLEVLRAKSSQLYSESTDEQSTPLVNLRKELSTFGQKLQFRLDSLLSPDKATSILQQVLTHENGLTLKAVNTRLAPLADTVQDGENSAAIDNINRYELELQLEGGYLDTLHYLRALEALPWKFFWSDITYATTQYPLANVDLEIYTLGQPRN